MKEGLSTTKIDHLLAKIKPHPVVALVDDDTSTLDLVERALTGEGYALHRFARAEDLLERLLEIRPDVIVMEAILPGISGLSVLEELRPKDPGGMIPVLILSKKIDPRAKLLAFRRGALDYLAKPFDAEELAARVRALVRSRVLLEMARISSVLDPLTLLYNRRFLTNWLGLEIARTRRYKNNLSCLWMDFDGFKRINEEKGERFGDQLLRDFGSLVTENVRSSDVVGRVENDQFLLFLPSTPKEGAMEVGRRLRSLTGKRGLPSFCTGIVSYPTGEALDASSFLEKAEEALVKARSVGESQTAVLALD